MDELLDGLIDSFSVYIEAKKELAGCVGDCEYDAGYFCQQYLQYADEAKEDLKENLIKLIKKVNDNG